MFDVAQLIAHQPLPRGSRVAIVGNSDALALLAADAAASNGLEVVKSVSLGAEATGADFEDALDLAIDDDEVDSVVAVYIPPLNTSGVSVANVLAAVGEQSDKPLVSTFLGTEGVPELLRVPDLAGNVVGRGSVPSYPAVESAVRALARVVEHAAWLDKPDAGGPPLDDVDSAFAKRLLNEVLMRAPEGRDLTFRELQGPAAGLRHRGLGPDGGHERRRGRGGRRVAGLGRRPQGHRRAPAQPSRPGPRVAQHRQRDRDA